MAAKKLRQALWIAYGVFVGIYLITGVAALLYGIWDGFSKHTADNLVDTYMVLIWPVLLGWAPMAFWEGVE